ncbi:MAG: hypothetical protein V8S92_01750 [Oscillospiraceae bacterium]
MIFSVGAPRTIEMSFFSRSRAQILCHRTFSFQSNKFNCSTALHRNAQRSQSFRYSAVSLPSAEVEKGVKWKRKYQSDLQKASMRRSASCRFSSEQVYAIRMKPSPHSPKALPGMQTTFCSSSRRLQN